MAATTLLAAAELKPEASASFDHYVKLTEQAIDARSSPPNFLWLDQHPTEKTRVWMSQSFVISQETLDHGEKIEAPDASIQHWLGVTYLETATFNRVRDMLLDYAGYKDFFKQHVIESRLIKHDGSHFEAALRLHKKQITQIALNLDLTADYQALDPKHATILSRSTRITEARHSTKKGERDPAEDQTDYLWRLNMYWRLEQADPGVFVELETVSLSQAAGTLHPGRYLSGFQGFPRELTAALIEGLETAFPAPRK